jgi:hypothetical protein
MTLATSSMLVSLRVKQWSARKYDRTASEEICETHDAKRGSGNFNKQLIDRLDLKPIQRVVNSARNYHYQNTLAWDHDGAELLPSKHYLTYMTKMSEYKDEFDLRVNDFIDAYPALLTTVMNNLSGLYNAKDYPSQDALRNKFSIEVIITPVPEEGDFRVDLPKKELDKLQADWTARSVSANQAAEKDLYMRLYTDVAKAVVILKTPDKIFRNSLILNVMELCNKIPDMNLNDSQELNDTAKDINRIVSIISIEELRKDKDYRYDEANRLEIVLNEIEDNYVTKWGAV